MHEEATNAHGPLTGNSVARADRQCRRWLWGFSSFLRNGAMAAAFGLAVLSNRFGLLAVAALIGGAILRHVLEATSCGD
jgi:hypothetical protein